jgi:CDP-2,3-bis-(O-geranylgeranyl)-sn-glycerol synthase
MIINILEVIWLLLPAGVANMSPVVFAHFGWLKLLDRPLDNNVSWRGKRLFGAHKTWRGFLVGILAGALTGYIQYLMTFFLNWDLGFITPQTGALAALFFGSSLGLGALAGDAFKSLVKRQFDIAPGKSWRPWDQIDSVLGGLIAASFFITISWNIIIISLIIFGLGSYLVSWLGFKTEFKDAI